jgi:ATP-dependent RNA helicase DDX19/DBP5
VKAVYKMGYVHPSQIQVQTIPHILKGINVMGQAQTGSGKSACFVVGMLYKTDTSVRATQSLCVAPTRELVQQLYRATVDIGQFMDKLAVTVALPQESGSEFLSNVIKIDFFNQAIGLVFFFFTDFFAYSCPRLNCFCFILVTVPDVPLTQHVVIGTPGTIRTYLQRGVLSFQELKVFAMDEADNLLDIQSLGEQVKSVIK